MENKVKCSSCHKELTNISGSVTFKCPNCNKSKIVRCYNCRQIAAKYTCPECEFSGPN